MHSISAEAQKNEKSQLSLLIYWSVNITKTLSISFITATHSVTQRGVTRLGVLRLGRGVWNKNMHEVSDKTVRVCLKMTMKLKQ